MRTFGSRVPGLAYADRPGAYALLVEDSGRLCVVRTRSGFHLPGGGLEPGESDEDGLRRELREECCLEVRDLTRVGEAVQYVHAAGDGGFAKLCVFYAARLVGPSAGDGPPEHEVAWIAPSAAARQLVHESQRWIVAEVLVPGST